MSNYFMAAYQAKHEINPSLREISKATGITSTSLVKGYIERLIESGRAKRVGVEGAARCYKAVA